jgi:cytochrome c oxidase assembly factor CtaG
MVMPATATAAPGWLDLITGWRIHPTSALVIVAAGWLYITGVRRLARRGRRWPAARSAAFAGALAAAVVATQSGVAYYEHERFSIHMIQHVLLGMVLPLLIVLSAPITLALQSARPAARQMLRSALHSVPGRVLAHPLVGWSLFGSALVVLYLTPLLDVAARHYLVHLWVHAHMVLATVLFLVPLVGIDTLPRRLPHAARLLALIAAIPFHTVVAMAMVSASTPIAPETYPLLDDQRTAAAVFWGAGEVFTLIAAGIVVRQWWVADQRAAAREDRATIPATRGIARSPGYVAGVPSSASPHISAPPEGALETDRDQGL